MSLPFSKVRVVDLTTVIAGPYCSYHLGMMGAEVIKVELPQGGDIARRQGADPALNAMDMGASYLGLGAGKKSLTLNLKHDAGKEIFRRLAGTADVVLENYRPGVMTRLGLDFKALSERRPDLIYCAISGFGQEGPYSEKPAYDQIVQGLSGAMSATGTPESGPIRAGYPVSDTVAGINAAFAIAAALYRRREDGQGQFIDVSMLDSTISIMGWTLSNYLIGGQVPTLFGNDNPLASPSGTFRARDGAINIGANSQTQFEALCGVLGREALRSDPRFSDVEARLRNNDALKTELERTLGERSGEEWVELLNRAGIPAGPVLTLDQAIALPPVGHRGSVKKIAGVPGLKNPIQVFTAGYRLSGGAPEVGNPPPSLGGDNQEILSSLGYSGKEIARFQKEGVL